MPFCCPQIFEGFIEGCQGSRDDGDFAKKEYGDKTTQKENSVFPDTDSSSNALWANFAFLWFFALCGCEIRDALLYECPSHLWFNFTLNNSPIFFFLKKDFFNDVRQRRVCETENKKNAASFKSVDCKAVEGQWGVLYSASS